MKIALVHDYLAQYGGAERVVQAMHEIWPAAPIYTSVYDPSKMHGVFENADVRTSSLQRYFGKAKVHKLALPFFASAFEEFNLSDYDVVLSSSSGFAKGVITQPETCHICYCHTPSRLAWRYHDYIGESASFVTKALVKPLLWKIRAQDQQSAQRVDHFVANSFNTARRIKKFYGRDSQVLHAPVETRRFSIGQVEEEKPYFLIVSRLLNYKRVDLAIEAFTRLRMRLIVVGDGPDAAALKERAGDTVEFAGRLPDDKVATLMRGCRALIFPGEEDFGITPLEAMACGRPVIAFGRGGALETVIEGTNGLFFREQTASQLMEAVLRYCAAEGLFCPATIRNSVDGFHTRVFKERLVKLVDDTYQRHLRSLETFSTDPNPLTGANRLRMTSYS